MNGAFIAKIAAMHTLVLLRDTVAVSGDALTGGERLPHLQAPRKHIALQDLGSVG